MKRPKKDITAWTEAWLECGDVEPVTCRTYEHDPAWAEVKLHSYGGITVQSWKRLHATRAEAEAARNEMIDRQVAALRAKADLLERSKREEPK